MTEADRRARIDRIRDLPRLAAEAVRELDDARLDTPYGPGKWTSRQIIHHLADSHLNAFVRMKLIATEDRPTLKPYDQDAWAALPDGRTAPVESSLRILEGLHGRWTAFLETVPGDGWTRAAHHPEAGTVTLEELLDTYAGHGELHLKRIHELRRARGW